MISHLKGKGWRWWLLAVPCAIYFALLLLPFIAAEFVFGSIADFIGRISPANKSTPEWLIKAFNWADKKNDY
ncbi:TMhelix containing protein [Vibrio phage 1.198.B._10N.286.54.F4]|nr:TMhelix containing protein [Vibrio phage 1.198.A._10N.286.54.F4]AUR94798.1 TMhelix containing protein [Vibrio phage 1.198.B._10N.286.54.F4]